MSSWLVSLFFNPSNVLLSMLLDLLLANIKILLGFFFSFLLVFNIFFTIPFKIENARLVFAVPTGAPMTVANDSKEMLPVVTDKTINDLSK